MFERRLKILIAVFLMTLLVLVGRLAWLQVLRGAAYESQANKALSTRPEWLDTIRGQIFDRHGRILAVDRPSYHIALSYRFTRLFDERFWTLRQARWLAARADQPVTAEQAKVAIWDEFGPERLQADELLAELARVAGVSPQELLEAATQVNDRVYVLRLSRARRQYYRTQGLDCPSMPNAQAIVDDLERVLPDPIERAALISKAEVREMYWHQPALPVDKQTALEIEEILVGRFGGDMQQDRPISVCIGKRRIYPYQDTACHLIGQLDPVTPDRIADYPDHRPNDAERFDYYFGDRYGGWGTEKAFESLLRGRRGWVHYDIDDELIDRIDPQPGRDVTLTIDIELQQAIQQLFHRYQFKTGGVVVIDVVSGEIIAAVSEPTFDLNDFYQSDNYRRIAIEQRQLYWNNRALSVNYQPGSTIKPMILLGGLQAGLINMDTTIDCSVDNKTWVGPPMDIHNHGPIAGAEAVQRSCNFYFIRLGQMMGQRGTRDWLDKLRYGQALLAWPEQIDADTARLAFDEKSGHIAPIGRAYPSPQDLNFMCIGRGALDGSVLHIANAAATIARDGVFLAPTLIRDPVTTRSNWRVVDQKWARSVQEAMQSVIYHPYGTAYEAFNPPAWGRDRVLLAGKTGSTDYSVFSSYARADDGRCLAVGVLIEIDLHGADAAAPLSHAVLQLCARWGYLPEPDIIWSAKPEQYAPEPASDNY